MPIHHGAHARIEWDAAQVLEPRHAHAFEAAVERARDRPLENVARDGFVQHKGLLVVSNLLFGLVSVQIEPAGRGKAERRLGLPRIQPRQRP